MQEQLVEAYIGDEYSNIVDPSKNYSGKAGVLGFLFGPILFFYYRSYLIGFGAILVQAIISSIISTIFPPLASNMSIVYGVIYGYITYPIYLWDVRRKMNKLAEKNADLSKDELIALAMRKSGHSVLAVVLYALFILIYIVLAVLSAINGAK